MKNKEIKQIIFSQKKNKKWIIVALVLVLTLGGGSLAAVVVLHRTGNGQNYHAWVIAGWSSRRI